jgi:hypothetical protein
MERANVAVRLAGPESIRADAVDADIVVLHGAAHHPVAQAVAARRTGLPTVVHVDASDIDVDGRFRSSTRELIDRCGRAVAATPEGLRNLREADLGDSLRTMSMPRLVPEDRYHELRRAHADRHATPLLVIGWAPGEEDGPSPWDQAVEEALSHILEDRTGARVDLVRGHEHLDGKPGVRRLRHEVQPHHVARWTLFVSSGRRRGPLQDDPVLLDEAGVIGVPTLVAQGGWTGSLPGRIAVAEPDRAESWTRAINAIVVDASAQEQLSSAAAAAAESLHRPAAADAVVHRFLGWLDGAQR